MQNAEWPGRAGTDQWNVGVAHNDKRLVIQRREHNNLSRRSLREGGFDSPKIVSCNIVSNGEQD